MRMSFRDSSGTLYSGKGLRFGGFSTIEFLEVTAPIEAVRPGVREEIIGEAHYLAFWVDRFPEIAFFVALVESRSIPLALLICACAYVSEIIRFYALGPSLLLSHACRLWDWTKLPLAAIAAIFLWPESRTLAITLVAFVVIQGWTSIVTSAVFTPIRLTTLLVVKKLLSHRHPQIWNFEGMVLSTVIDRWSQKLAQ
jgi:hypothetical protein